MNEACIAECRRLKAHSRRDENNSTPTIKQRGFKGNRTVSQAFSKTFTVCRNKNETDIASNEQILWVEDEKNLKVSDDEIIEILDTDHEEPTLQQEGRANIGLMSLVTLIKEDLETLQENRLVNDACIDALADVLQSSIEKKEVSICHTGLWAAVRDHGWGHNAKMLIHPDPAGGDKWSAYKFTKGHLESKLLLITCNFPANNKVEAGHWILAIREKGKNGKHKLHILDSLGKESGRTYMDILKSKLAYTPFFQGFSKGKIFDVITHSECECGARVAKDMMDIVQNYSKLENKNIPRIIGLTILWEKENDLE